jgi:hypothetical protein
MSPDVQYVLNQGSVEHQETLFSAGRATAESSESQEFGPI